MSSPPSAPQGKERECLAPQALRELGGPGGRSLAGVPVREELPVAFSPTLLLPAGGPGGGHGRRRGQPSPSPLVLGTHGLGDSCEDRRVKAAELALILDQPRTFSGLPWGRGKEAGKVSRVPGRAGWPSWSSPLFSH